MGLKPNNVGPQSPSGTFRLGRIERQLGRQAIIAGGDVVPGEVTDFGQTLVLSDDLKSRIGVPSEKTLDESEAAQSSSDGFTPVITLTGSGWHVTASHWELPEHMGWGFTYGGTYGDSVDIPAVTGAYKIYVQVSEKARGGGLGTCFNIRLVCNAPGSSEYLGATAGTFIDPLLYACVGEVSLNGTSGSYSFSKDGGNNSGMIGRLFAAVALPFDFAIFPRGSATAGLKMSFGGNIATLPWSSVSGYVGYRTATYDWGIVTNPGIDGDACAVVLGSSATGILGIIPVTHRGYELAGITGTFYVIDVSTMAYRRMTVVMGRITGIA